MKTIKYILLSAVLIGFTACSDDDDSSSSSEILPDLTAGTADFSNYVSLGNSLTAGFTDNALFIAGQQLSLPNTLAQKFSSVGGGSFTQPLMNDNYGGLAIGGTRLEGFNPRLVTLLSPPGPTPLESVIGPVTVTTDLALNNPTGPFNNLGVPGAKSYHLLAPGYGNIAGLSATPTTANPYFVRMASQPNASVIGDAMAQNPTFFSLWIGNNDVLGYALSGGESNTASPDYDPITPVSGSPGVGFNETYGALIASLTANGAQGVVANIPDVTSIPHFTTVPHNPLDPSNPDFGPLIPTLNTLYGALNDVYAFLQAQGAITDAAERTITFSETGASAVVIRDESLTDLSAQITQVLIGNPQFPAFLSQFGLPAAAAPQVAGLLGIVYGQARQANANDLLVLPSSSVIGTANSDFAAFLMSQGLPAAQAGQFSVEGVTLPLADKWCLIPTEQNEIANATNTFNATIQATANQAGLAFVDANSLLNQLANGGIASGSFVLDSRLILGGAFSLDGVHPTSRGYALIANEFMKAIDATYGSNFEASGNLVDIGDFPTNFPPDLQ